MENKKILTLFNEHLSTFIIDEAGSKKESQFENSSRNNPDRDFSIMMGIFERDYLQGFYYQPLFEYLAGCRVQVPNKFLLEFFNYLKTNIFSRNTDRV